MHSELDLALIPPSVPELHTAGDPVEPGLRGPRPLDERDGVRGDVVVEQGRVLLLELGEPVEVEMGDRHAPAVGVPDREGRRGDRLRDAQRARRAADQRGLAGAELTADQDDVAGTELRRQPLPKRLGLCSAARARFHRPFRISRRTGPSGPAPPRGPHFVKRVPPRLRLRSPLALRALETAARAGPESGGSPPAAARRPAACAARPPDGRGAAGGRSGRRSGAPVAYLEPW